MAYDFKKGVEQEIPANHNRHDFPRQLTDHTENHQNSGNGKKLQDLHDKNKYTTDDFQKFEKSFHDHPSFDTERLHKSVFLIKIVAYITSQRKP